MTLICLAAGGAMMLSYRGLFDVCASRFPIGAAEISVGVLIGVGSYMLTRNANDLMDR